MKCLILLTMLGFCGCATDAALKARIDKLEKQEQFLLSEIDRVNFHTEYYRFDTSVNECQFAGALCKLNGYTKASLSDDCQKQVEECVIRSYKRWMEVKTARKWK